MVRKDIFSLDGKRRIHYKENKRYGYEVMIEYT
jgi:hypothetical protein